MDEGVTVDHLRAASFEGEDEDKVGDGDEAMHQAKARVKVATYPTRMILTFQFRCGLTVCSNDLLQ